MIIRRLSPHGKSYSPQIKLLTVFGDSLERDFTNRIGSLYNFLQKWGGRMLALDFRRFIAVFQVAGGYVPTAVTGTNIQFIPFLETDLKVARVRAEQLCQQFNFPLDLTLYTTELPRVSVIKRKEGWAPVELLADRIDNLPKPTSNYDGLRETAEEIALIFAKNNFREFIAPEDLFKEYGPPS